MGKPDAPAAPDPRSTAAATTSTNVGTAVANAYLNNTNQITPEGELRYDQTGTHQWKDPYTGVTLDIPTFTGTQIRTPAQQAIVDQQTATKMNLAGMANQQSAMLSDWLSKPMDLSGAPAAGDPNAIGNVPLADTTYGDVGGQQRSLGDTGRQQTTFGEAGDITRGYGPEDNFSADRGRTEEALFGRLQPQLQKERARIEQQLADQGIRYGSQAYADAFDPYNRQSTDARLAVTAAGGAEQQRMMDMAAKEAGFQNAAQQQAYQQAQGRGTFANEAQAQQYQQALQSGTFANQAQTQAYQQEALRGQFKNAALQQQMAQQAAKIAAQNQARSSYMTEQYAQRNQPINEVSALMSGSQVKDPNLINTPTSSIANTDTASIINNKFSQDMASYQQQSANFNSLMGGIFGMMGGLAKISDVRAKKNINRIGTVLATDPDEEKKPLPIYEYEYKGDASGARHTGPMAQDVEKIDKRAVKSIGGVKHIDMTRMGSILRGM
jgi:hypothetical protein